MEQAVEISRPGITLQLVNSNITARNDVNVTFNNPESSILKGLLASLNPVISASYNSYEARQRSECFPNTRVQVLHDIEAWIKGESHQAPIYILDGVAGIGKSTIAQTIAIRAAALGLLGATFFFSQDEDLRRSARHFFPTIAYQLSCYNNTFATHITRALEQTPDASGRILADQLSLLLLKPLEKLLSQGNTPILIVIDALDECEEKNAEELLTLFGRHIHQMKGLKILITSRPEEHIRYLLCQDVNHEKFCLHQIEDSIVHSDIRLYLQSGLSTEAILKVSRNRQTTWQPTSKEMEMLCGICGTLFIIAATAINFILDSRFHPQKQLSRLLDGVSTSDFSGSKYFNTLDHTYIRILCAPLTGHNEIDREWLGNLNRVLGALITLANPLPYQALALLLELDPDDLEAALSRIHSLVAPIGNGAEMTFRIHHKSFPDFITDKRRIQKVLDTWKSTICPDLDSLLLVDVVNQHLQLAKACFKAMDRGLKQNMADIHEKDWYRDKEHIPHVKPGLIPRDLAYAALHWASHLLALRDVSEDLELRVCINSWATRHILSWIETMVILEQVHAIYGILQDAIRSLRCAAENAWAEQTRVLELLSDACRFVQQGGEVMKISPMHLYRSCLTFVPIEASLYKIHSTTVTLRVELGKSYHWNPLFATLIGHSAWVNSIALSNDGSRVVSGSHDCTIRLWDANTGAHLSTLTGHSDQVNSVVFSSDGSRVASGSNDWTVRLWDANTGTHLFTLAGHSRGVITVAFSSNGSRVTSGSDDRTVRLWDANTGAHLSTVATLAGHLRGVKTVAFSSDGSRVASGSDDRTARLWDANTGAHLSTLRHSRGVNSVAFSSDGSRVVSGSNDRKVRLWDANTGAELSKLAGHSHQVNSVAFSSDGSRVVSGSNDCTVRLWDANTGAHLSTLAGHSGWVNSVVFSSDGSRVASGSHDRTVRLWDAKAGAHLSTLAGHSGRVNSIAFSSDGSRVVSGSYDCNVLIWDTNTDAHLFTLAGHLDQVNSVAFSSDGLRVASGSDDWKVRLWDANTGAHLSTLAGHSHHVNSVAFSSDGSRVVSGSNDCKVRLWDANTGAHLSTLAGHSRGVKTVAFLSDDSRVASGSDDRTVRLWDANTGAHLSTLAGHSHQINSVAFSSDGSRVASGSDDRTARLWDANTDAHLSTLIVSPNSIVSVFLLPSSSPIIDQVQPPGSRLLQPMCTDSISLLILTKRENPPITGIIVANLVAEGRDDPRWEVVPMCWFPPDIRVRCLSVDHLNARLAIGCEDGRVITLTFLSHRSNLN